MWNTLHVDVSLDDLLARPVIGIGGLTREDAHAEVQEVLDAIWVGRAATQWRTDVQRVRAGSNVWATFEYDDDPRAVALAWVDNSLQSFREAGVDIRVANLPS